jgi:hypothetical protein
MRQIIIPEKDVDLERLGLINQGLFQVDGELAARYNNLLKQVFGWESEVDSFRVDKRGLSPELCIYLKKKYPNHELLEFGENYLNIRSANRYMLVLSPDQKDAPLVASQTSYEDGLFDEVYRQARHTIEDVTQNEVMFGELDNGITMFKSADDLLQLRTIETSLDTLNDTVKKYFELRTLSDGLDQGSNALDLEYIARMQNLVKKIGDPRNRAISKVFPITKEVHCFYVEFFKGVHCLRNFKNKDKVRSLFVSHEQGRLRDYGEEVVMTDLHDKKLIDMLHRYEFLEYNESLVSRRLEEIENEVMISEGIDVIKLSSPERKRKIIEKVRKFPVCYAELREISKLLTNTRGKIENIARGCSYETRLKLSVATQKPTGKPEIINHMLAELDPSDVERVYDWNRKKLIVEFPSMALNRQRYIAHTLLSQLNDTGGKTK